ncbi:hemin ABC transporter ATP-binding protein [Planococcus rifietoensis]|uniref:Hemin ABC transporter ATP-binding protein n=1 Tax=Planococcus rifietoensis TaxID=200991 RepID=A0A0U2YUZ9_9BACL|nr:ABC transporter ATP-binding protein [Planococcus rifietoensis]ALS75406.1 hemin ABC transporter ATP-binding protein [Planococcus rifietoensis]
MIFTTQDIRKTFKTGEVAEEILKGIDLSLTQGEITALVGASGSGKSTLLTIAAGLQLASGGEIHFDGEELTAMNQEQIRQIRAESFGFVFQSAHLVPFLTAEEQLLLMLETAGSPLSKKQRRDEAARILQSVGMGHRKTAYPASLSGGEKQRVAIARAIVHQPKLLFADEPTASLDSTKSREVMELLQQLTKTLNIATLMVTHEEDMLAYADRVITMKDGRLA